MSRLDEARRRFAVSLRRDNGLRSAALEDAFAAVPREEFLGRGPWLTLPDSGGYRSTPDADPVHVYRDVAVALDAPRLLNNGAPGFLARSFDVLDIAPGESVVHVGCATGYYTAIVAELVGPRGRVVAVELDPVLERRAERNLKRYRQIELRHGDGTQLPDEPVDVVFVNAGATHPRPCWLDALRPDGRLAVPLTAIRPASRVRRIVKSNAGRMLFVRRRPGGYDARFGESCAIQALIGGRDPELQKALRAAFEAGGADDVRRLRRDPHDAAPECWLHAAECCLSR